MTVLARARAVALARSRDTASGIRQFGTLKAFRQVDWRALLFWGLPTVALGLVPILLWTGATGALMNLGGDDSHLMYAYPDRWLSHASLPVLDQNLGGYNPRTYFVPFTVLLLAAKSIGLNAQGLFFGLALALTYLGVAWLVLELTNRKDFKARACAGFAGAVAVCAPLVAETQWTSLLTAIYWEPLLPWLLLLFLRSQKRHGVTESLIAGLAVLALAPAVNQVPWTISCGLLLIAVAAVSALAGVYRVSVRRLLVFISVVSAINAFWIAPILLDPFLHQSQLTSALSASGKADALAVIRALAPLMSSLDAVSLRNSGALLQAFSHPELRSDEWSQALWILGILPAAIIVAGSLVSLMTLGKTNKRLLIGLLGVTIIFLYLQTLRFVPGGEQLFEILTKNVPGWTAERNFFDKFAIPMVEVFAITAGVALLELLSYARNRWWLVVPLGLAAGMIVYDAPFFRGAEFGQPNYQNVTYTRVMPGLPDPYLSMLTDLEHLPPGPVLSLPLSRPAWSVVPADGSGVYIGISPIYFLTGRSDYNGIQSFASPTTPDLQSIVGNALERGRISSFEAILKELGVKYLVVSNLDDRAHEFYRVPAVLDPILESSETASIVADIAPRVIADYGAFQLREVTPSKTKPALSFLPGDPSNAPSYLESVSQFPGQSADNACTASIRASSPTEWLVSVDPLCDASTLVYREPYSPDWQATLTDPSTGAVVGRASSVEVDGFANAFHFNGAELSGRPLKVTFSYQPAIVTLISGLATGLFLVAIAAIACRHRLVLALRAARLRVTSRQKSPSSGIR